MRCVSGAPDWKHTGPSSAHTSAAGGDDQPWRGQANPSCPGLELVAADAESRLSVRAIHALSYIR